MREGVNALIVVAQTATRITPRAAYLFQELTDMILAIIESSLYVTMQLHSSYYVTRLLHYIHESLSTGSQGKDGFHFDIDQNLPPA